MMWSLHLPYLRAPEDQKQRHLLTAGWCCSWSPAGSFYGNWAFKFSIPVIMVMLALLICLVTRKMNIRENEAHEVRRPTNKQSLDARNSLPCCPTNKTKPGCLVCSQLRGPLVLLTVPDEPGLCRRRRSLTAGRPPQRWRTTQLVVQFGLFPTNLNACAF